MTGFDSRVTPSDIGQQFKEMSEPFLLLGIVENQVRWLC